MKTTKFDVIKLIVESEQASPETFKPIFLTAISYGAKQVYSAQADLKHVKPLIESASYLISQIEHCQERINDLLLHYSQDVVKSETLIYERQIQKFTETLTNVLNQL